MSGVTGRAPAGFLLDVGQVTSDPAGGVIVTGTPAPVTSILGGAGDKAAPHAAAGNDQTCDQRPDLTGLETTTIASLSNQSINLRAEQLPNLNLWVSGKVDYHLDVKVGVSPGRAVGLPNHGYALAVWDELHVDSESLKVYSYLNPSDPNPIISGVKLAQQIGPDIDFPPVTVTVPVGDVPVPVVLVPKVVLELTAQGGFQVGATVTGSLGMTVLSGIGYDPDQGWQQL